MSASVDEAEHSLEMHLPYIYKMLSLCVTLSQTPIHSFHIVMSSRVPG
jgi:predicted class III extradiol MEMO1 family dioxygenase